MNNKPEILAPAGSMESLIAAVRCGANAVYLGTKGINARRGATNFTFEELKQAVEYCHARDVKIYLALNILISDSERELAYKTVEAGLSLGVDAFIIQDLGLAKSYTAIFLQQECTLQPSAVSIRRRASRRLKKWALFVLFCQEK